MKDLNIYQVKQKWKWFLFLASVLIGASSLWYTNRLVNELSLEERKKIELWADATRLIATTTQDPDLLNFLLRVTEYNTTIPVILTDSTFEVIYHRNLHFRANDSLEYLMRERDQLRMNTKPIEIRLNGRAKNYLFYDESYTLKKLAWYPYIQLSVILIFIIVSYFAFSASRKAEQNKVWIGLSRETAHQLGTPTSSLIAWLEILREKDEHSEIVSELEHDVSRLQVITERFSHIGSRPVLALKDICEVVNGSVEYMKNRIPSSVSLSFRCKGVSTVMVNVNLFNWVIENLIKNALDAVGSQGTIEVSIFSEEEFVYIDIKDSGKGIPRKDFKRVFKPGFTTKSRGWGLGLSLAKRIVSIYHNGRIFVLQSELHRGTTFRIVLKQVQKIRDICLSSNIFKNASYNPTECRILKILYLCMQKLKDMSRSDYEIMAPVGSWESLAAAIQGGADAVYFGVDRLNMRSQSTVNFTFDDLKEIVRICNEAKVKTYLTINTILYDQDMSLMRDVVDAAKKYNITAVIASDIAAINYANSVGVEVHISTQQNVSNLESVKFFSKFADVVVMARELSLLQVARIAHSIEAENICGPAGKPVRLEMFVHGALCMAVSGKCYLSLHEYNKSANRGSCLQVCRRSYIVTDKETDQELQIDDQYIMSPKDLCTIDFLNFILDAGVKVLKIEGRARSAEYVKTVVSCYNEALNAYLDGTFTREKIDAWKQRLATVFNRGFWDGYYLGRKLGEWSGVYGSKATKKKVYIGKGTNYFSNINVAEFLVETGSLKVGDDIIITGPTTGVIETKVPEIRVDLANVNEVTKGLRFSMPINKLIRRSDKLYKLVSGNPAL